MGHKTIAPAGLIHMRDALVQLGHYAENTSVNTERQVQAGVQYGLRLAAYRPLGSRGFIAFTYESDLRRALKRMEQSLAHEQCKGCSPDVGKEMHAAQVEVEALDEQLAKLDGEIESAVATKLDELATQLAKVQQQLAALCRAWDINA